MKKLVVTLILTAVCGTTQADVILDGIFDGDTYKNSEDVGWFNGHRTADSRARRRSDRGEALAGRSIGSGIDLRDHVRPGGHDTLHGVRIVGRVTFEGVNRCFKVSG